MTEKKRKQKKLSAAEIKERIYIFCSLCLGYEEHPKYCTAKECPLYHFRPKLSRKPREEDIKKQGRFVKRKWKKLLEEEDE